MKNTGGGDGERTDSGRSRRAVLASGAALCAGFVAGCTGGSSGDGGGDGGDGGGDGGGGGGTTEAMSGETTDAMGSETTAAMDDWRSMELTNVLTGRTFTVGGFDAPVVLETFAVWCPVCTRQQQQLGSLKESMGSDVAIVSLNIDPNENAKTVKSHATENGFDWQYAVSPPELTKTLADQFGNVITNAPSAPVVAVCQGGPATLLEEKGVKSASTIESALGEC